jgi:hypothetical protein
MDVRCGPASFFLFEIVLTLYSNLTEITNSAKLAGGLTSQTYLPAGREEAKVNGTPRGGLCAWTSRQSMEHLEELPRKAG